MRSDLIDDPLVRQPLTARRSPSMTRPGTADVVRRFNDAFVQRDPDVLVDLVADDCVMESTQPARRSAT
jgi:hypothetical protein